MAALLVIVAIAVLAIGGAWFVYKAFMVGVVLGIACFFFHVVGLVLPLMHWKEARGPFAIHLFGFGLLLLAHILAPHRP